MKPANFLILICFILLLSLCLASCGGDDNDNGQLGFQRIVLKADDMVYNSDFGISKQWSRFLDYVVEKDLKAGVGILGNSLLTEDPRYFQILGQYLDTGRFEIWNHGFDHQLNAINPSGSVYSEFQNTTVEYQLEHLLKTQDLAQEKLGVVLTTFGAPGNKFDKNTETALRQVRDITVWLFGSPDSSKIAPQRMADMEFPGGNPVFFDFVNNYYPEVDLLVFQLHPGMWDEAKFAEFEKMIDFLSRRPVIYVLPNEILN
ncbi:MAG: DUF2334 domain-containing protein [Pseudomonadota bacterium]